MHVCHHVLLVHLRWAESQAAKHVPSKDRVYPQKIIAAPLIPAKYREVDVCVCVCVCTRGCIHGRIHRHIDTEHTRLQHGCNTAARPRVRHRILQNIWWYGMSVCLCVCVIARRRIHGYIHRSAAHSLLRLQHPGYPHRERHRHQPHPSRLLPPIPSNPLCR